MSIRGVNALLVTGGSLLPLSTAGSVALSLAGQPVLAAATGAAVIASSVAVKKGLGQFAERKRYLGLIERFDQAIEDERKADQEWHDQRVRDWLEAEQNHKRAERRKRLAEVERRDMADRVGGDQAPLRIKTAERAWERRVKAGIEADKQRMAAEFEPSEALDTLEEIATALKVETSGPYAMTREFGTRSGAPFLRHKAEMLEKQVTEQQRQLRAATGSLSAMARLQQELIRKPMASTIAMTAPAEFMTVQSWGSTEGTTYYLPD
ncbi:hypothetical protein SEA_BRAXOADDIE_14 [Rhodococcus phage Braxoaddie]|nr:hypothetical protein SEA_BRAXOADDIE_14 [Rhodococcus phage Braxoaddie]